MKIANISEQEAAMYCMIERIAELEKENYIEKIERVENGTNS